MNSLAWWDGKRRKVLGRESKKTVAFPNIRYFSIRKTLNKVKKLQITTTTNYETLKGRKKQHS